MTPYELADARNHTVRGVSLQTCLPSSSRLYVIAESLGGKNAGGSRCNCNWQVNIQHDDLCIKCVKYRYLTDSHSLDKTTICSYLGLLGSLFHQTSDTCVLRLLLYYEVRQLHNEG